MKIPWVVYVSAAAQVLVPLAALRYRGALPSPRRWIVLWGLLLVLGDAIDLFLALQHINNLWTSYVFSPFEVAALLIGLSVWHINAARRRTFRYAAGLFAIVEVFLLLRFEHLDQFSVLVGPIKALLLLVVAVVTLLACLQRHEGDLLGEDWFWIGLGLSLRYGTAVAVGPLSALLWSTHPAILNVALQAIAWIKILASLIIARGILCPVLPRPSSGPSSPAFSPSPSSSPRSGPPW